jgi:hypothetical protein
VLQPIKAKNEKIIYSIEKECHLERELGPTSKLHKFEKEPAG